MTDRSETVARVTAALHGAPHPVAIRGARKVDAAGVRDGWWTVSDARGVIVASGVARGGDGEEAFEHACRTVGLDPASRETVIDADGMILTPGYVDIHAHGAWERSFDDGADGIDVARTGHAVHGTTRQVLSLITNPVDVMCRNIRTVRDVMASGRPDVLGCHLEGPFLALKRKGAHDPNCLKDPVDEIVDEMLEASGYVAGAHGGAGAGGGAGASGRPVGRHTAAGVGGAGRLGCIRQVTIAPELEHGVSAIRRFAAAGVVPAVGHCDADYTAAKAGFDAGAGIMTHMFNAMNGLHHREPGPIPAAVEDPRVTIELINDGFHVDDPMVRLGFGFAPHRIAFVTDAMAATGCPDGAYKLGELDVNVVDGHARLVSNGAIAGSTLVLEVAVQRAVLALGFEPAAAVEAATLTPARAFGFDRPNPVTGAPIGLVAPGYAADLNLLDPATWAVRHVWCAGRALR
ncbi:N-acetylglucosamine-6-phosphate deacetylase [Bifidobacterium stellenboschense]|uniref:N-acetylglucosamine-6-phosphate deacetylase n=1 Tax=Bifidobacterium stellenboschense TaxID=762211 RepID=A0A087DRC3_9BIFI|nr:N-acetylglucosamine-6-phosphate deacetylase [Bifidobacterium stellenboschense]KFI98073.1 N-acetylglucosamine-6-phosphate deacetylase [Bifidobacterium stellenboschense]